MYIKNTHVQHHQIYQNTHVQHHKIYENTHVEGYTCAIWKKEPYLFW